MKRIVQTSMCKYMLLSVIALASVEASALNQVRNDLAIKMDTSSDVCTVTVDGYSTGVKLESGLLMAEIVDDSCAYTVGTTCLLNLNYLRLATGGFIVGTSAGDITFTQPVMTMRSGTTLINNDGGSFWVPPGTPAWMGANVSGSLDLGSAGTKTFDHFVGVDATVPAISASNSFAISAYWTDPQSLWMDAFFDFTISVQGQSFSGQLSCWGSAVVPFDNVPPEVSVTVSNSAPTCGESVVLDAIASDGDADELTYAWYLADGTRLGNDSQLTQVFSVGTNMVTVVVTDTFGAATIVEVEVVVADAEPPAFTTLPVDVVAYDCGAIALGAAAASSSCGAASITNDAPATFKAGMTVVTWTATGPTGLTSSATQRVWVSPGDNPECCPAGSNVIVGTSNNDILRGTPGVDCIIGLGAQDTIDGFGGDDIISAGDGDDIVNGGSGNDVIFGGSGQDVVSGNDGNDGVFGGSGDDKCNGDAGDDFLNGGDNNDTLSGGSGSNTCLWLPVDNVTECNAPASTTTSSGYSVCSTKPEKCADCAATVSACQSSSECAAIIECVALNTSCNLPHECSATCEANRTAVAVQVARNLASCFGGI